VADGAIVGPAILAKLALVCKDCNRFVKNRIHLYRQIYNKWAPRVARAYHARLINHPIKYEYTARKFISVNDLHVGNHGVVPLVNLGGGELGGNTNRFENCVVALAGITLISKVPSCAVALYVGDTPVAINSHNVDSGMEGGDGDGGGNNGSDGPYLLDVGIPLDINPLTLYPLLHPTDIQIAIMSNFAEQIVQGEKIYAISNDFLFVRDSIIGIRLDLKYTYKPVDEDTLSVYVSPDPRAMYLFSIVKNKSDLQRWEADLGKYE
tara:strand:+ start:10834 stop:11628 length:795 start_codon:yes stop_codon:yes gene_type:complete